MSVDEEELRKEIDAFVQRYKNKETSIKTEEFIQFKEEIYPSHFNFYEKACNFCGNIINIKADPKKEAKIKESLETCHINTTPNGVAAFAILFPMTFIIVGIILAFLLTGLLAKGEGMVFFIGVIIIMGVAMMMPLQTLPNIMANSWRLRASNQLVLSIFYIVSYMRHTSNLELAIKFTSDHIAPPLSYDFKKIMWDVESGKYNSIKESLEHYLDTWRDYNMDYIESMHLIESSLYEGNEKKRIAALEKALNLILESTYENMLHFAQNLKSPITMLHMLGVILPILGLVILPLVVSFLGGVQWYHISVLYNVFLAAIVWYLGKVILSTRPSGYGQSDITEVNPELKKQQLWDFNFFGIKKQLDPKWPALIIIGFFFFIAILPLLIHQFWKIQGITYDIIIKGANVVEIKYNEKTDDKITVERQKSDLENAKFKFLGFKKKGGGENTGDELGPYGIGATLLSLCVPLGLTFGLSFYYKTQTKKIIEIRDKTRALEEEFASALFQLGNRIGDGLPPEIAFSKVADVMENTLSGKFFEIVTINVTSLGLGIEEAIFHKKYGAINKYPSSLILSSMKVFVESAKKGPDVAAEALINISIYIKEMHKVEERLKDLMAEVTSSMTSQINFLAPTIAGIVIGLTSMITTILGVLQSQLGNMGGDSAGGTGGVGQAAALLQIFGDSIPTYYFSLVIGVYIIQITYLLTTMLNTIQNGYDPLSEKYLLGLYFKKSGTMYVTIAFFVMLMFNMIAAVVIQRSLVI